MTCKECKYWREQKGVGGTYGYCEEVAKMAGAQLAEISAAGAVFDSDSLQTLADFGCVQFKAKGMRRLPLQNIHNPAAVCGRFWSKVIQGESPDSCWDWSAAKDAHGYGVFCVNPSRRTEKAHRYSWEIANGPIPDGMNILHKCDNPSCANPEHLFIGTQADNMADMQRKKRGALGDKSTARRFPERLPHGDAHFSRNQPELVARGERHWNAKLDTATVRKIREMNAGGTSSSQIAAITGINRRTVSGICSGRQWRHV